MDREGLYGFHMAEHHSTPLGWVPSPSVFVSAAIQRTTRLRIGPLVYVLPMYHPLRVYEEVCMLDHMSRGRLMFGVGRGAALVERRMVGEGFCARGAAGCFGGAVARVAGTRSTGKETGAATRGAGIIGRRAAV